MTDQFNEKMTLMNHNYARLQEENNALKIRLTNLDVGPHDINFLGQTWTPLFGVKASDKLCFEDTFWTDEKEFNSEVPIDSYQHNFKTRAFFEKPVKTILIRA